jgi:hypothetical protein
MVESHSIPRIGPKMGASGLHLLGHYEAEEIQLIFIHSSQMNINQLNSFIFLLESLHYKQFVL